MTRIALLHPGAMGAAVGADLVDRGHTVVWLSSGRSETTRRRAEAAGLEEGVTLAGCDVVLSIVPPAAAIATAQSVSDFGGLYIDANAISPDTSRMVGEIVSARGATYADGGIIGSPPTSSGTTRLCLSGSGATEAAALFAGARLAVRVLDDGGPTAASALKMTYAAWTKGSSALLLAVQATAVHTGVADALADEWRHSQPDLLDRLDSARTSAESKGWRWTDEMREIARTFADAGQTPLFGSAAADVFARYPRPD